MDACIAKLFTEDFVTELSGNGLENYCTLKAVGFSTISNKNGN